MISCPRCGHPTGYRTIGSTRFRCNECAHRWDDRPDPTPLPGPGRLIIPPAPRSWLHGFCLGIGLGVPLTALACFYMWVR